MRSSLTKGCPALHFLTHRRHAMTPADQGCTQLIQTRSRGRSILGPSLGAARSFAPSGRVLGVCRGGIRPTVRVEITLQLLINLLLGLNLFQRQSRLGALVESVRSAYRPDGSAWADGDGGARCS